MAADLSTLRPPFLHGFEFDAQSDTNVADGIGTRAPALLVNARSFDGGKSGREIISDYSPLAPRLVTRREESSRSLFIRIY